MFKTGTHILLTVLLIGLVACEGEATMEPSEETAVTLPDCDPDNGGLQLPDGFCATVVADTLGRARHVAVRDNGDVYVMLRNVPEGENGGIAALRDTDGDGAADEIEYFGEDLAGTGIGIRDGYLYVAPDTAVLRYQLAEGQLVPQGEPELVVGGFLEQGPHAAKPFSFDDQGNLYVNVGAPSNACQEQSRTAGSSGMDPCPQLERQAGIWRFSADELGQTQVDDGERYATGIRNAVAHTWNPLTGHLYVVQHGRDQLSSLWPDLYTQEESAELPAEEFFLADEGSNFGWPYCYYDHLQGQKVLAPEYGGDGSEVGRCAEMGDPIMAFPGHWGPNDVLFYTGDLFPESYHGGAFIAFHGSWNRAPLEQQGYRVVFVPFDGERPAGDEWETFADGFAGVDPIESPGDAEYRPTGLALGPNGSLYISDDAGGRIWRVVYTGE